MTFRSLSFTAAALSFFFAPSLRFEVQAAEPPGAADARLKACERREQGGWIFIHLEGSPSTIGFQHGSLLAKEIEDLLRVIKPFQEKTTGRDWGFYRRASETMLWRGIDREYQDEIDGIVTGLNARGVKADRWDLVALNALEELPYYYAPWVDQKEGKKPAAHAPGNCSAFIAAGKATKDGRIVMGHNCWTNYVTGSRWNIIFDVKPERGNRILMDGLPGVIVSDDDFAINSAGMMITETTITQFNGWDPAGKPEFSRARKAMQYATSIDEFVKIMLAGNNGGYANDWLVGDDKTGEIALFELGLKHYIVKRKKDGVYFGSNFPVDDELTRTETTFDATKKDSSPLARKARWEELIKERFGKIDVEIAKEMESDDFDVITGKHEANERTLCGIVEVSPRGVPEWDWGPFFPGGTVQSKVVDGEMAKHMKIWAAFGHASGPDFHVCEFLKERPEYEWMRDLLGDLKKGPWTVFDSTDFSK